MGVNPTTPDVSTYGQAIDEASLIEARPTNATSTAVQGGWEAAEKLVTTTLKEFPVEYKHSNTFQLIKFIDLSGPFASYRQHFLKDKEGRKSYVWDGVGAYDPLETVLKSKPEIKRAFSIVNLSAKPFQRQMIIASPRLYKTLHAAEFSPQGPLTKNYWALSRTGEKQQTVYNLMAVKARDLQEDWGLSEAEVEAAIAGFQPFTIADIRQDSFAALEELAKSLL